jgi:hypothetical protein
VSVDDAHRVFTIHWQSYAGEGKEREGALRQGVTGEEKPLP